MSNSSVVQCGITVCNIFLQKMQKQKQPSAHPQQHQDAQTTLFQRKLQRLPDHVRQRIYAFAAPVQPLALRRNLRASSCVCEPFVNRLLCDVEHRLHAPAHVIPQTWIMSVCDSECYTTHVTINDVMWYRGGKGVIVAVLCVQNVAFWVFVGIRLRARLSECYGDTVRVRQRWEDGGCRLVWVIDTV